MSAWAVPGYAEERQLGKGASGRVVAAVSEATGKRVAIKYLTPGLFSDPASWPVPRRGGAAAVARRPAGRAAL